MATMNNKQREALSALCARYKVEFREAHYHKPFDLPDGWVAGWIGGDGWTGRKIYVGVSPEGEISSWKDVRPKHGIPVQKNTC